MLAFFWPFLFNNNGISIMVTPLNSLAEQMTIDTNRLGITTANITDDNGNDDIFKVSIIIFK